jgi:biopolymer transport protein ExbB
MLSSVFLGLSLVGAEWVLYLLLIMSVISVALMFERARFYRKATRGIDEFRRSVREAAHQGKWDVALRAAEERARALQDQAPDMDSGVTAAVIGHVRPGAKSSPDVLSEIAEDAVVRTRLLWEKNLAALATIGANAPFVGLFGTVLGIIKAFHDLSQQVTAGAQTVTAGISEALVATAVGILVAVPAVVAFNLFQRRVRSAVAEAEALKSYLIGKLVD